MVKNSQQTIKLKESQKHHKVGKQKDRATLSQTVNNQSPTRNKVEDTINLQPSLIPQEHKKREFSHDQTHKDKLKQGKFLAKKLREDRVKHQLEEIVQVFCTPKAQTNNKNVKIKAIEQVQTLLEAFLNGRCLEDLVT